MDAKALIEAPTFGNACHERHPQNFRDAHRHVWLEGAMTFRNEMQSIVPLAVSAAGKGTIFVKQPLMARSQLQRRESRQQSPLFINLWLLMRHFSPEGVDGDGIGVR
ncbi:hypothetical protein MHU86_5417 [Fragilaria crotonensis]|nr:hypothetical protein MHU86_5417 [Fragilaria crotonensis]